MPLNIQDECDFSNANLGELASKALQPLIFLLTFAALGIRFFLKPAGRTKMQLMKDGAKQLFGAALLGCMNNTVSEKFLSLVAADKADACAWYFVQIILDTTVGVFFTWVIFEYFRGISLRQGKSLLCVDTVEMVQSERETKNDLEQGLVGGSEEQKERKEQLEELSKSPDGKVFLKQVFFWVVVVGIMKLLMVMIIFCFATPLQALTNLVFKMIPTPAWKVIFAKIATPFLMNIFQYWMFDVIFLKEYDLVKESLMKEAAAGKLANLELSQEELKEKNKELIKQYDQLKSDYDNQRTEYEANTAKLTKQIEEFQEQLEAMAKQAGMPEELVKKLKDKQITLQAALTTHKEDQEKAQRAFDDLKNQNQTPTPDTRNAAFAAVRAFFRW